ncbi:LpqB family beta-propeller domain-containing protein [Streptomyces beijiangensis]|uniref:GerMN domain-containing protein n=1 Tax=Streptomyces beijiangensis TaxID=163361 RepID=A0A939FDH5_9ACTN|nr:LpqB family beta-propeller domain-containing protein [Streptomyces beijiangensis]MBO0516607.1 GerMN domain-containing protein [Streptomyces beijiangensis]
MPTSGDIKSVDPSQRADSQVKVYAVAPRAGAEPSEIVDGFLEAMTSDDLQFATARKYLTGPAAKTWDPAAETTVLTDGPTKLPDRANDRGGLDGFTFKLGGTQVAVVDKQHAYRPHTGSYQGNIHLVLQNTPDGKEWRIDSPPKGLLLGQSDFGRNYQSVNKYYFASLPASGSTGSSRQDWLVADPVYVRQRIDPESRMDTVTQTVASLLSGPTNWLKPVVGSRFPTGTALKEGTKSLAFDDRNALKVPLNAKASNIGQEQCRKMAAQLLFTLRDVTVSKVAQVELERSDGSQLCVLSADQAEEFSPDRASGTATSAYFIDAKGHLERLPGSTGSAAGAEDSTESDSTSESVPGPLGAGSKTLGAVAVARDEQRAAAVTNAGSLLYVASITSEGQLDGPLVTSQGRTPENRLSAPSWDGLGDLWVADRDLARPRLLRFTGGSGAPQAVDVSGLNGARIESLRMSADGVRIALLVSEGGRTTLKVGRVERQGSGDGATVTVSELTDAAPQMAEVTAMSWAGRSRLVVVGKETGGVQQVRYMQTDGSVSVATIPGANRVTAVAAADDSRLPLVALSQGDGIVRLPPGANWKTVVDKGASPVYPG